MNKLIGFMGAPGTGKTTLACSMKEYVLTKNFSSDICIEYAREFCLKFGVPSSPYSQYRITSKQMDRETTLLKGVNEFVFTDSPVILGYVFGLVNTGEYCSKEVYTILSDLYEKFVIDQIGRYYKIFHLRNENPFDDGCRNMEANRHIADVMDGFVQSHKHLFPIVVVDIPIKNVEKRKEFVWENIK